MELRHISNIESVETFILNTIDTIQTFSFYRAAVNVGQVESDRLVIKVAVIFPLALCSAVPKKAW